VNDDTRTILEGTKAHILLAEIHPAFHDFVDAGFSIDNDLDFYEKTFKLVKLINDFKKARDEYKQRKTPYHLIND
jgi:hypothetical protein